GELLDEPGLRGWERDAELVLSESLDSDLGLERVAVGLGGIAAFVRLCALDAEELVRVVRGELRRDRPLPRPDVVLGRHGLPVRPPDVVTQVENDVSTLDRPALCGPGGCLQRWRFSEPDERIHQ